MPKGWIAIFKPGTHTDAAGNTNTWTEDDVKEMAEVYNNQPENERHDAPIVKGHPKNDDPAMGWVERLKYEGGKLLAKVKDVNKDFVDEVKNGAYKKVSVRLYPNKKLLRHVGYLGATPPAVKGLGDAMLAEYACFNDDENEHDDFFNDMDFADDKTTVEQLKNDQEARSKKYGISVPPAKGLVQKPEHYSTLTDEDFADPVHYRFPIHDQANTIVSMSLFNRYDIRNEYSEDERQIIGSRLVNAGIKLNIDSKANEVYRHMYEENDTKNNSNFNNQYGETEVDEEMKKLRDSFIAKVKDDTNEEVATKVSKHFADVFSAKSAPKKTEDDNKSKKDGEDTNLNAPSFEESEVFKKLQAENKAMQEKMRKMEFEEFLSSEEMKTRVTPAMKSNAMAMLELAHNSVMEFSEDGKSINPVEKVKKHLMSLQPVVELGKLNAPDFSDNEFAEQDKFIDIHNQEKGF